MEKILPWLLLSGFLLLACQNDAPATTNVPPPAPVIVSPGVSDPLETADTLPPDKNSKPNWQPAAEAKEDKTESTESGVPVPVTGGRSSSPLKNGFAEVTTLDPSISLDIRYATANNFTKSKIYDCPRCLLRPEAAAAIVQAHKMLQKKGLGLKMFDCYRPRPYQQRLWDKVPNPDYVTPPAKGSMHSRGAAVDLTIVDAKGRELDMGTPYDYFGVAAHTDHTDLPAKVLVNRRLLRETLEAVGFKGIRTEWWHFSYQSKNYPLSDYVWPCDK